MQSATTLRGLQPYLSFIGTFVQLGATLLLVALFTLLRRYTHRRRYFRTWTGAWVALAVALCAVVLRHNVLPSLASEAIEENALGTKLIYFVYQLGKLCFYGLLLTGTLRYVRAAPGYTTIVMVAAGSVFYGLLSVWNASGLNEVVVWQAPIAVATLAYCALLMLRLPPPRRSLGAFMIGGFLAAGATLWTVYFMAFNLDAGLALSSLSNVVNYNTYLDLLWHISLGFGMVVVLFEDMKHESDAAHAELAVAHHDLRRMSYYDSVTGTLNRSAFDAGVGLEAARASFGSVVMFDMDDLKRINDQHGHAAGDAAMRHLVGVLRAELRPSDKLYRWGGDEFLLVCPRADAALVTSRLRALLNDAAPVEIMENGALHMRVSVGGARFTSSEDMAVAIDRADRAMYADKQARKNPNTPEPASNA
jgi:diguanylate cyclase (GGDEF)-like protein